MSGDPAGSAPRVLAVTVNPALDVSMTVDHLVPEQKMRAYDPRREAGGGGVNVTRVLNRLGVAARALVVAGGSIGDELMGLLEAELDEVVRHPIPQSTRESVAVTEAATGRQYRLSVPGPTVPDPDQLERLILDQAVGAGLVVLSGGLAPGLPPDFYPRILARLDPATLTIVDCGAPALEAVASAPGPDGHPMVTLIKPSQRELADLAGWEPTTPDEIQRAASQVLARGAVGAVVASRGPSGAVLVTGDRPPCWFRPPPVRPVSAVGAGDSMVAGIAAALVAGQDLVAAVRQGVAAGTAAVLTPGSQLARAEDIERFVPLVAMNQD